MQEANQQARTDKCRAALSKLGYRLPEDIKGLPRSEQIAAIMNSVAMQFIEPLIDAMSVEGLKEGLSRALKLEDRLLGQLRETVDHPTVGRMSIACRAGCSYSCNLRVTLTAPFVLTLAEHLKSKLPPLELEDLKNRIESHVESGNGMPPLEQATRPRMCPLNIDGLCIGYESRPATCRSYHSFNVDQCREYLATEGRVASVIQHDQRSRVSWMISRAVAQCSDALGWDHKELEFIPALQIALNEPDAAERYLSGEDVFSKAYRPDVLSAKQATLANRNLENLIK